MKQKLVIIDAAAEFEYDYDKLSRGTLGGTEASVLRIADGLVSDYQVSIYQKNRAQLTVDNGIRFMIYRHKDFTPDPTVDVVIVVRNHKILKMVRKRFPRAKLIFWSHCFHGSNSRLLGRNCYDTEAHIVTVSRTHLQSTERYIEHYSAALKPSIGMSYIYNPVCIDDEHLESLTVDPRKLIYISSPHKGLGTVLEHFQHCRAALPQLKLYVADPGYFKADMDMGESTGVVPLQSLTHTEVLRELRSAFCLFYPQQTFAETFGLVFAEANAVGVPVITGDVGAAREIISGDSNQVLPRVTSENVLRTLSNWYRNGRPKTYLRRAFCPDVVLREWKALLRQLTQEHQQYGERVYR